MFRNEIQPELFPEIRNRVGEQYENLGGTEQGPYLWGTVKGRKDVYRKVSRMKASR